MPLKQVFVVCERTLTNEHDEDGSLSIESIHTTLESANRWAQALANNRYEEYEDSADRHIATGQRNTKWGKLFAETITTPTKKEEFAIEYSVELRDLEGDELVEESDHGPRLPAPMDVEVKQVEAREAFEGMKFSWVGELDDLNARNEIRYLVFDNGGAWQPIEKCLEGSISDYVIAGKNVPERHQQIIEDKDISCINRPAFLKMAKNLGLPKEAAEQQPINALKCFARMNFTVLGNVEEPGGTNTKQFVDAYGTQQNFAHTSQMDYIVRRGSESPDDLQIFEAQCRKLLKFDSPTVITPRQLAEMIFKKSLNSHPAENPRLSITSESIKATCLCLDGIKISIPTGDEPIDGINIQQCVRAQGGSVLSSIHAIDLADYVVTGTNGLSDEHKAMAKQFGVKVITVWELHNLIERLEPFKQAKDMLGAAMGYLHHNEPKSRKRKSKLPSMSQPPRKSAKLKP